MHLLTAFTALLAVVAASGRRTTKRKIGERQLEAAKRWQTSNPQSQNVKRGGVQNITFTNSKASGERSATSRHLIRLIHSLLEFYVDGKSLPLVDFDIGPSWAGLLPISSSPNETRQVCT
jgi:carboxypeptidase D